MYKDKCIITKCKKRKQFKNFECIILKVLFFYFFHILKKERKYKFFNKKILAIHAFLSSVNQTCDQIKPISVIRVMPN